MKSDFIKSEHTCRKNAKIELWPVQWGHSSDESRK